jgi:HYR domain-containing protein/PKD domain-containing protein
VITRTFTAIDSAGNSSSAAQTITVIDNTPPVASCPADITVPGNIAGACGALITQATPTASDNCSGTLNMIGTRSDSLPLNAAYPLGVTMITWSATDAAGNSSSCVQKITVTNPNPVAVISTPVAGAFFPAGVTINFNGSFTDNPGGTHAAEWRFGGVASPGVVNESSGAVSGSFAFASPGIYTISLRMTDGCGGEGLANTVSGKPAIVFIFDPVSGLVTGGGQFDSPAGALPGNPGLSGKASFNLSCVYNNGSLPPKGSTEFSFGGLNFQSTSYEFLVVSGAKGVFRGVGKINGAGNFGFMLTVLDGDVKGTNGVDRLRIKIWDMSNNDSIVYDNQMGAPDTADPVVVVSNGNIVVHR